jgi:hypothetical protein
MQKRRYALGFFLILFSMFAVPGANAASSVAPVTQTLPATGPITFADTAIGSSNVASVQLTINTAGTLTLSAPTSAGNVKEYTVGAVSGCTADGTTIVASGSVCSFTVTFAPHYPGIRQAPLSAILNGQVYTFALAGYANGPLTRIDPGYTLTVAGTSGTASTTAPVFNVPASQGTLYLSRGITIDASDNVYIADSGRDEVDVIYQTATPQLACLIVTESPATFGASGTNGCADATSQPTVGNIYQLAGMLNTTGTNTGGALALGSKVDPMSVSVDAYGNVYIPDDLGRIRVIYQGGASVACLIQLEDPTLFGLSTGATSCSGATSQPVPGYIYNVAGSGTSGTTGDGGLATKAEIINAFDVAVDSDGDIFFPTFNVTTGTENGRIRVVYNGGALAAQLIQTENPTVTSPTVGYIYTVGGGATTEGSDGILATSSGIAASYGIKLDRYGNIYFADKTYGSTLPLATARVRVIYNGTSSASNPLASLIATENPGTTAQSGYVYTIAGSTGVVESTSTSNPVADGVLATSSHLVNPYQLSLDAAGDIYVSDDTNNTIQRISASTGYINTVMGVAGTKAVNNGMTSELYDPWGIAVSSGGSIYSVDWGAYRLRVSVPMDSQTAQAYATAESISDRIALPSAAANSISGIKDFLATNIGTTALTLSTDNASSDSTTASFGFLSPTSPTSLTWPGVSECQAASKTSLTVPSITSAVSLSAGQSCQIGVAAEAESAGTYTGTVMLTDNSQAVATAIHTLYYSETATGVGITFASSPAAPTAGQSTQLTATLVNGTTTVTSGTVQFSLTDGAVLGSASVDSTGTATITTTALTAGTQSITITYSGDTTTNALFTPATLVTSLVVAALPVPTVTIAASPALVSAGASVTLTANVTSAAGTPTGTVDILDAVGTTGISTTVCSTTALAASGAYSCTIATLPAGTNNISAVYAGDGNFASAGSTMPAKVTVTALATTTIVTATPASVNQGQAVTLAANVGGYVSGVSFNGMVTFSDSYTPVNGTTASTITYGPVSVAGTTGVATYQSTTLAAGTHVISASFANDLYYALSSSTTTSTVIVAKPSYSVTPTSSSPTGTILGSSGSYSVGLNVLQGGTATIAFSVATVGGYSGTVTSSCGSVPSKISCSMSPSSASFTGANNTVTVTGTINTGTTAASNAIRGPVLAMLGIPGAGLLLLCMRRKRSSLGRLAMIAVLSALTLTDFGALSGCGNGSSSKTSLGTYSLSMNFTDGTTAYTVPVTVTVQGSGGN